MIVEDLVFPDNFPIKSKNEFEKNTLTDILKTDYPHIFEAVTDEKYPIEYEDFSLFKEVHYQNEIAGFITLKILSEKRMSIEEAYIIPDYRGNDIMYDEIIELVCIPNLYLYARRPNYTFVKMLESHGLTNLIEDKMVGCGIDLLADSHDVYTTPETESLYKLDEPCEDFYSNYVYDMDSKLVMISDVWGVISINPDLVVIVKPRKSDLKRFNYNRIYERFTLEKLDDISLKLHRKNSIIENICGLIEEQLFAYCKIENIMKNDKVIEFLHKNDLDPEGIKNHLKRAFKSVQLKDKYHMARIRYLAEHPEKIDEEVTGSPKYTKKGYKCPLCQNYTKNFENCDYCGFDFENNM